MAENETAVGTDTIGRYTHHLAETARTNDPSTPVLTCGDWTLADLVWHVTEVQDFWTFIIEHRPADHQGYVQPARGDEDELANNLDKAADRLIEVLTGCNPTEPAWSWASEQTVGFTLRRQTHEALTHLVDGLLACNQPLPDVSVELAADGIDEMLSVMLDATNDAPFFEKTEHTLRLETTESNHTWTVMLGERGARPTAQFIDDPDAPVSATIRGRALDLNLWLWGRRDLAALSTDGSDQSVSALRELIARATQ